METKIRRIGGYTPFNQLVQIVLSDKDVKKVLKTGSRVVMDLRHALEEDVVILGPVLPKIARINNYYRAQIIIKYKKSAKMDKVLKAIYAKYIPDISIAIDKNPSLL